MPEPGVGRAVRARDLLWLHALLFLYACASALSKFASGQALLSPAFLLGYGGTLVLLAAYALLWQQILKKMPLSLAFANKGAVLAWGMLLGYLIWKEPVTLPKLAALSLVFAGIWLVVSEDG